MYEYTYVHLHMYLNINIYACICLYSTKTLQEIVKRYMMVGFHAQSQKLAVGTSTGLIILYDLKTARRWQVAT